MPVHDNRTLVLALRAVQAIFAIIVLGLTGYGKSTNDDLTLPLIKESAIYPIT